MFTAVALAGALLAGCHFEESGLHWGADAGEPDDPDPTDPDPPDPGAPDASPSPDADPPPDIDAAPTCDDGFDLCPDGCVDLDADDRNCGECGLKCGKDKFCDEGQCREGGGGGGSWNGGH